MDTVEVLHNYNAEQPDELTLRTGDIIRICRRLRGGWSKGEINGRRGIFHEFFVRKELIVSIKLAHIKRLSTGRDVNTLKRLTQISPQSQHDKDTHGKEILKNDITNSASWPVSEKLHKDLFVSTLPNFLKCGVCLDVLNQPVQTICCGQSYCSGCIVEQKPRHCPHCNKALEMFSDKKSARLINELEVYCPYHIKCDWKGYPSEVADHLKQCSIKPVTCPLGCGKQFEQKNLKYHSAHCDNRNVTCPHCMKEIVLSDQIQHLINCPKMPISCINKCGKKLSRDCMKEHSKMCPNELLQCKFFDFGCTEKIQRKNVKQHMSSAMQEHLSLVVKKAKREERTRKALEQEIASLKAQLKSMHK